MGPTATPEIAEAYRHCRQLTREQAKNFYFAFITLPPRQRSAIYAAYAFCRLCDDITDGAGLSLDGQAAALDGLRADLRRAYDGAPSGPGVAGCAGCGADIRHSTGALRRHCGWGYG